MIDNIQSEIQCLRDDIGVEFLRWYDEPKQMASFIATEEEMQRIPMYQYIRSNEPADTTPASEYFADSNIILNYQTRDPPPRAI